MEKNHNFDMYILFQTKTRWKKNVPETSDLFVFQHKIEEILSTL